MTRIGAPAVTYDNIGFLCQNIDDLALAFIAPLQTHYATIHITCIPCYFIVSAS